MNKRLIALAASALLVSGLSFGAPRAAGASSTLSTSLRGVTLLDECVANINDPFITKGYILSLIGKTEQELLHAVALDATDFASWRIVIIEGTENAGNGRGLYQDIYCGNSQDNYVDYLDSFAGSHDYFFGGAGDDRVGTSWSSSFFGGSGDDTITSLLEYSNFWGGLGADVCTEVAGDAFCSDVAGPSTDVYIGFAPSSSGGSCSSPDFTVDGSADSATISDAVARTLPGGTLHFCRGAYDINTSIQLGFQDITLQGAGASSTILDGGGDSQILVSWSDVVISGLTFQNGSSAFVGGAIQGTNVTVASSVFTGNEAAAGGAINAQSLVVINSIFSGNTAIFGSGGAIMASSGTIQNSSFVRNTAVEHGGGVILLAPSAADLQQLRRNTFTRNTAAAGGAMTFGPCAVPGLGQATRVERANRFLVNRGRPMNIEIWKGGCLG